jgi:hypothetical protein
MNGKLIVFPNISAIIFIIPNKDTTIVTTNIIVKIIILSFSYLIIRDSPKKGCAYDSKLSSPQEQSPRLPLVLQFTKCPV